ncbi:DNA polymerase II large subunit [Candidatus Micrarchaeota archaeon]|nr:DNA polymerase II large subunit [Candidatus Micrarchaeota archaeon]
MDYFDLLKIDLEKAYAVAAAARSKGLDPAKEVEVKIAKDVAARVEGIVGPVGIAEKIRELEKQLKSREWVAFEIAKQLASGEIISGTKEQLIEQAIRTGVAILTEGVLVAPTEGIAKARIKNNPDGSDYVAVYYAGPIRSAGGTAAALSVVIADVARRAAGIGDYRVTESQVERYLEEVNMYEVRVTHLQYKPPDEDVAHIVRNCPVCVDGEPTEEIEVSVHRGVPGVETNRIRGGIPLVICEGIAQKASKVLKYTKKLNLGWDWLEKVIKITRKADTIEIKPDKTYLEGLVAGRPVFSYPSAKGGFRLRYGRTRTNGLMAKNVHPATMILLDNFLAYGTHMKIERPGKGCVVTSCETIEPPIVRLKDGSVVKVKSVEDANKLKSDIDRILFLGDILSTYGDFLKSNHPLVPSGYCKEWWEAEVGSKHIAPPLNLETNPKDMLLFCKNNDLPFHPDFTFNWESISNDQVEKLAEGFAQGVASDEDGELREFKISAEFKPILEDLLVEHLVVGGKLILKSNDALALLLTLGLINSNTNEPNIENFKSKFKREIAVFENLKNLSGVRIKPKSPTYIGARMGRPEKAKERKMDGSPNVLFPTGSEKNRSLIKLYKTLKSRGEEKSTNLELSRFRCTNCKSLNFSSTCLTCSSVCKFEKICQKCKKIVDSEIHCDIKTISYEKRPVNIVDLLESIKFKVGYFPEDIKGVKGLANPTKTPEPLEKGFFRSRYGVYVFRDGTSRFDATDVPLTHFFPKEIGVSVEKLKEMGYTKDYVGNELTSENQLVALRHQDVILAERGAEYFISVCNFIDEMLVNLYGLKPFYNVESKNDLIGQMAVGLSPHTSAAVLCRIIGFTKAHVGYAHPYFHAAKRRNADGDEDCLMMLMDCLINFSKSYLTENRGGTMDAPLVLTSAIDPREVDDEVQCMEFVSKYPLEFYQAAEKITPPSDIKIKTIKDCLGKEEQFESIPITHWVGSIDKGNIETAYVQLDSIPDKIALQFGLQGRIKAVDVKDAAERLILSHFIPDLYGNLRSYSRQTFRCVTCNDIYRRVPLVGKCTKCGGNLLLTINKGGIQKYLEISKKIVNDYDLPDYLKQRLLLVDREIKNIFEDEKIKQLGLADFV